MNMYPAISKKVRITFASLFSIFTFIAIGQTDPVGQLDTKYVIDPIISGCTKTLLKTTSCNAQFNKSILAKDPLSPLAIFQYKYQLDINNDGVYEISGNSNVVDTELPVGRHSILWTIIDKSGAKFICSSDIVVQNTIKPVILLTPNIIDLPIEVFAYKATLDISQIKNNLSISDDCCPTNMLVERIIKTEDSDHESPPTAQQLDFDCAQLGQQKIEYWLGDCGADLNLNGKIEDTERNWSYKELKINIIDTFGVCGINEGVAIKGMITDQFTQQLQQVQVSSPYYKISAQTDAKGEYNFLIPSSKSVEFYANFTETNFKQYIDQNDVQALNDYLLGLNVFTSPYFYIAADLNQDKIIDLNDLVLLKEFVKNPISATFQQFRFIDKGYNFNTKSPQSEDFPDFVKFEYNGALQFDFIGVRLGDLAK